MLIVLLGSGLGGAFFLYSALMGIQNGNLSKGPRQWLPCVATPALMFAICATVTIEYFYEDVPYLLTLALWLVFILAFEPAYRLIEPKVDTQQTKDTEE